MSRVRKRQTKPGSTSAALVVTMAQPPATSTVQDAVPADAGPTNGPDRAARIAEAAYFLAQRRSFCPGHELDDWLTAEREIDSALSRPNETAAVCYLDNR